jgi:cytochrome c-type biogenesis protein CcmE
VGPVRGDAHAAGLRFRLRDIGGKRSIRVVYRGSVPDQFKVGRDVVATGTLKSGRLASNSITTKCPSKYSSRQDR